MQSILVIDDDPAVTSLLKRGLSYEGFADVTLDASSHVVRRGKREVSLTSLEFKVLQEFLLHPRQVLPKDMLLERVWGFDFDGNVVEVYVKQLRQKLEAEGEPRLIQTIRNVGHVLRES